MSEALIQRNLLEGVFESIHVLIAYMDKEFTFLRVNRAYAKADGRDPEYFIGKNHFALFPDPENEALFRKVVESGEPYCAYAKPFEYAGQPERGVTYWDWRVEPVKDSQGQVQGLVLSLLDVTEGTRIQEALREKEERLRELFQHASDGIFIADLDGRYTEVNSAGCRMLGYTRDEIIGKTILDLIPSEDTHRFLQSKEVLLQGDVHVAEWTLCRKDGTYLPVEVSAKILADGRWQGFVRDISKRKRAEEALRRSEERFRLLFESVAEGVFGVDQKGNCIFINPAGLRLLGYSDAEQLMGKPMHPLIHHTLEDGTPCREDQCRIYRAFRENKRFYADDERFWRSDGSFFHVEYRSHPIRNEGRVVGSVATFADISERKKTEKQLRQAATVFDNTMEAIMVTDANRNIVAVNQAYTDITGFGREEVLGKNPRLHQSGRQDEAFYRELWQVLERDGKWQGEIYNQRKNGEVFPAWENINVVKDDQGCITNYVAVISDISSIKHAEQQLQEYREHLEEMVAQRTAALQASYKELEAFSYSLAHDLRTPLRAITSFSQILQQEAGAKLTAQERQDLQRIVQAGKHMAQLIDDILELARINRTEIVMETVDLSGLASTIIEQMRKQHPSRSVQVRIKPNLKCPGDGRLLHVALENLLGNAWKYTGKRPDAYIEFGAVEQDGQTVYYVRDNGVGFDMRFIDKLFKPFQRLHKPDEFPGTGIGLASALSIIQRHHGKLWAESSEGQGSTFYFTLHTS